MCCRLHGESGSPSKSWGRPAASHSDRSLKRILCGEGWAVASSPNVVNPGGGCPRLWFLGSPVLNFAWEFLYEVSSHQKDTCAKQEGNRAFFFFCLVFISSQMPHVEGGEPPHGIPDTALPGCKVSVSYLVFHENCSPKRG